MTNDILNILPTFHQILNQGSSCKLSVCLIFISWWSQKVTTPDSKSTHSSFTSLNSIFLSSSFRAMCSPLCPSFCRISGDCPYPTQLCLLLFVCLRSCFWGVTVEHTRFQCCLSLKRVFWLRKQLFFWLVNYL